MKPEQQLAVARLIRAQRWAGLATADENGAPQAAMVAYAFNDQFTEFYIHVSQLSTHTKQMLAKPTISLVISEPDTGEGDPQTLARLSISGLVRTIERGSKDYEKAKNAYLNRLPTAEQLFGFGDFVLFALVPESIRFVGGFAQAHSGTNKTLEASASLGKE